MSIPLRITPRPVKKLRAAPTPKCEIIASPNDVQIAQTLVVAKGTVDTHVHHILKKLGCSSRAQVAVWAASHGLLDQD